MKWDRAKYFLPTLYLAPPKPNTIYKLSKGCDNIIHFKACMKSYIPLETAAIFFF